MDRTIDELDKEIKDLKQALAYQNSLLNKLIMILHMSDTDLKDYLHILDS